MYSRRFSNGIYSFDKRAGRRISLRSKVFVLIVVFLLTHLFLRWFFPSNERLYIYYNIDELRVGNCLNNPTFALIVSYRRAGFTLISSLLSHADESFYIPDPLQILLPQGYYKENMVCFENGTYRRPISLVERHDFMITAIHRLLTCKFSKLHPLSKAFLVNSTLEVYKKVVFSHCHSVHSASVPDCIHELEEMCMNRSHRIITSEHLSMENIIDMMEYWPNLKVIHVVRDPRGIVHSRLKIGQDFQLAFNIESHSSEICSRIFEDVKFAWYIQRKFNDRISAVSYEAFVESPYSGTSFLYDFLNMLYTDKVWYRVYHSTHAKEEVGWSYNSTRVAYSWRTLLEFQTVKKIDHSCHDMYRVYGYNELTSADDLRNHSVPTRHKVQFNLKGFL